MIECGSCGQPFEPVRTRWLCPNCRHKESCCEGEALPERPQREPTTCTVATVGSAE